MLCSLGVVGGGATLQGRAFAQENWSSISTWLPGTRTSRTSLSRELGGRHNSELLIFQQDISLASYLFFYLRKKARFIILIMLYHYCLDRCVNLLPRGGTP